MKVKVTVSPGKTGNGTLLARYPVTVATTEKQEKQLLYKTRAHMLVRIRTTHDGRPRARGRF